MRGSGFDPVPPILIVSVFVFLLSYLVYKFVSLFTIVCLLFALNAAAAVGCLFVVVVYGGSILICLLFVCLYIVMVVLISKKKR